MKRSDISTHTVLVACNLSERMKCGVMPYEILRSLTGAPDKVIYAAMRRDERRGYIDYGVSLRTAWLTDVGRSKLLEPPPAGCKCA